MLARLNRRPRGFYGLERFGAIEAALATGLQMETIRSSLPSNGTILRMLTVLMISFAPVLLMTLICPAASQISDPSPAAAGTYGSNRL